jgi:hypothetical protein
MMGDERRNEVPACATCFTRLVCPKCERVLDPAVREKLEKVSDLLLAAQACNRHPEGGGNDFYVDGAMGHVLAIREAIGE